MKKILALALALIMVLGLATTVSAEGETYSITINNAIDGHIYEAYQIFTGDLSADAENDDAAGTSAVLSNVKWGANATQSGEVADTILDTLTTDIAISYVNFGTEPFAVSTDKGDTYVIENLAPGYYLIKDQDDTLTGKDDTYTSYIIEVVENSTVTPKSSKPSSEKKVKDTNDTTADTTNWQDSADYDIGDAVPFQLSAKLPADLASYETYYLAFHDQESKGLTFQNDAVVKLNGTVIPDTLYEVVTTDLKDGCTFEVIIEDVKLIEGVKAGDVITVEYTSVLNENAVLGSAGNPNTMHIEYSNNPNWEGEGKPETGETPDDKVIVFTYKVIVNKTDGTKPLAGAGFTLYKNTGTNEDGTAVWTQIGEQITGTDMTTFEWSGLDDGDYKLEETLTPAGYNTIDPIEFTVTAEHDVLSDNPTLTKLEGGEKFTGEVSTGALTGEVVNQAGTTLPETGGMGTTIFYIIGGLLVAAAVVLLVTKKRMANAA